MSAASLAHRPTGIDWMRSQPNSAPSGGRCSLVKFPAGSLISVDTADLGDFCDFARDWSLDHQPIGAKKLHLSVRGFSTPLFQLAFLRQTGDCCWQGVTPSGTVSVGVPLDDGESPSETLRQARAKSSLAAAQHEESTDSY